jgi:hypothetical protein
MLLVCLALPILATPKVHPVRLCVPALDLQPRQEGHHTSAIGGTEHGDIGVLEGRDDVDETRPLAQVQQVVALGDKSRAKADIFFKLVRVSIGISEAVRRTDGGVYGIWGMWISLPVGTLQANAVAMGSWCLTGVGPILTMALARRCTYHQFPFVLPYQSIDSDTVIQILSEFE